MRVPFSDQRTPGVPVIEESALTADRSQESNGRAIKSSH
jgi:hypothetical protein